MSKRGTWLSSIYVCIALISFVTCWRQNLLFMQEADAGLATGFLEFWPALLANHATISITVDIALLGLAAMIWMVFEARKLGVRFVWLYILLSFLIGISVMVPLFLAARERALAGPAKESESRLRADDMIGLGLIGVWTVGFALWTLGQ